MLQHILTLYTVPGKSLIDQKCSRNVISKGAFHLSELTGQIILVEMIISLLITTILPDQSNPK